MFSITTPGISSVDPKVSTAVEFLFDVDDKDFKESDLRRYLISNRGLTSEQVDEALSIHSSQLIKRERELSEASWTAETKPGIIPKTFSEFTLMRITAQNSEKTNKGFLDKVESILSLITPSKHDVAYGLIVDFLIAELDYCKCLKSLIEDYRYGLIKAADARRFSLSRDEILEIFHRIPQLHKFHKSFYTDLGADIGRMVVRLINFFKQYTEYIREFASSVQVLREHSRDRRLYKCLDHIKWLSKCKMDIYDLLLAPLHRILEYRDFFTKLCVWGDRSHADFRFLGKAARRVGRIAVSVELHKERIINACELNKVQHIVGDQCDLLLCRRLFIRRGEMIRRTTGWKARNKRYIFFLFNDVFLWTTMKDDLQNVVKLHKCTVLPSGAKMEPGRKFKVEVEAFGRRSKKVIHLECKSEEERNQWFISLETAIARRKLGKIEDPPAERKLVAVFTESESEKPDLNSRTWVDIDSMDLKHIEDSDTILEHTEIESAQVERTYLWQIDSLGDFESEISAYDENFYQQYGKYTEMAEYTVSTIKRATLGYEKNDHAVSYSEPVISPWENSTQIGSDHTSIAREPQDGSMRLRHEEKSRREVKALSFPIVLSSSTFSGSNILRRSEERVSCPATTKLQHTSSLSFRLDDKLVIHPDTENYHIRLIDFVDICEETV